MYCTYILQSLEALGLYTGRGPYPFLENRKHGLNQLYHCTLYTIRDTRPV